MKKLLLAILLVFGLNQTQAQMIPCDSIEYTIEPGTGTTLQLNGTIAPGFWGTATSWMWSICDANLCYGDTGQTTTWTQFTMNDTLKVCLTTILEINNDIYTCYQCDSLIYDGFGGWMMFSQFFSTGIIELEMNKIVDNRIYDLTGRELKRAPVGVMYIRNRKLYIK